MGLFGDHTVHYGARLHEQTRRRSEGAVGEHKPWNCKLSPCHRVIVGVELRKNFSEKENKESKDYGLQHETEHGAHARKNGAKGKITQHHDGDIHQIVGNQNSGEQSLRIRQQLADGCTLGCLVEFLALGVGKGKE